MSGISPLSKKCFYDILSIYDVEGSTIVTKEFREIEVALLQPHPENEKIYGRDEDVSDLIDQVKAFGSILDALKVTDNYVIISGHRRWKAAQVLGLETVPCEIVNFDSPEEELAALVLYNYKRQKTNEQRTREGIALFKTLSDEAVSRRLANLNQNRTDVAESATSENVDDISISNDGNTNTGLSRDRVAEVVGIKNGRAFDRMREVLTKADELSVDGNTSDAELYVAVLNRSPSAAKDLLNVPIESITEEVREKIRTGKVAPRSFINDTSIGKKSKKQTPYNKVMEEAKALGKLVKSLTKSISHVKDLDEQFKIREALQVPIDLAVRLRINLSDDSFDGFLDISAD